MHDPIVRVEAERDDDGSMVVATGREAWALASLIEAGERGCTPIEHPAPRWSHYVYLLRRRGLDVETVEERHGGPFKGLPRPLRPTHPNDRACPPASRGGPSCGMTRP
jgi:hypothetical protein